jgi:hypothetical protein
VNVTKAIVLAFAGAAVAMLVANYLFAIPVSWSIALATPAGGVILLASLLSGVADANWEAVPGEATTSTELHASMLAARLAEAARDQQRYQTRIRPRLAKIALTRVRAAAGDVSTLDDPRARAVLGPELHRLLTDARAELPAPHQLQAMLAKLEEV